MNGKRWCGISCNIQSRAEALLHSGILPCALFLSILGQIRKAAFILMRGDLFVEEARFILTKEALGSNHLGQQRRINALVFC